MNDIGKYIKYNTNKTTSMDISKCKCYVCYDPL